MKGDFPPGYVLGSDLPDAPPLTWIIRNIYPSDAFCLLPAKSNAGKSALVANVVASILSTRHGRYFLEYEDFEIERPGGRVVLATYESNNRTLRLALDKLGITANERSNLLAYVGDPEKPHETLARFGDAIDAFKPDIAIADSLVYLFDPNTTDVNDYLSMIRALSPIRRFIRELNGCLLVTTHARKAGGDDLDAVLGSTGIGGSVDKAVLITKHGPDINALRTMSDIKTRLGFGDRGFPKLELTFEYESYRMRAKPFVAPVGGPRQVNIPDKMLSARIVERFRSVAPAALTKDEALDKIGARIAQARVVFDRLVSEGKLFPIKNGRYVLLVE